jgi:hypothetical protein
MRIRLALILILVVGAVIAASLLLSNRTLSSPQLAQVKTACLECHSVELRYSSAVSIHDIHATLNCSQCHGDSGLPATAGVHSGLEWTGIGLAAVILAGIVANFIKTSRRTKAK